MVKILNDGGSVSISGEVFTTLAGDAATRCFGVKGMVGKTKESGLYQLLRRESMSRGVSVTFHEEGAVVSEATGVPVKAVDVFVDSVMAG